MRSLGERRRNFLRKIKLKSELSAYSKNMTPSNPLYGITRTFIGDSAVNESEEFSYYDAFYFWSLNAIKDEIRPDLKLLDIGGKKLAAGMLSVFCDVTFGVLKRPNDGISNVTYIELDAGGKLPFCNSEFDVFMSPASIHTFGTGRYGDRLNPQAIPDFIQELYRIMKPGGYLFLELPIGPDLLRFNAGYNLSFETILKLFKEFTLKDFLFESGNAEANFDTPRYTKDSDYKLNTLGYQNAFFAFQK